MRLPRRRSGRQVPESTPSTWYSPRSRRRQRPEQQESAGRDVPPPRPASDLSRLGQERTLTTNTTTAAKAPAARSLAEICEAARQANCGECWQVPGKPCTPEGDHVARFG